MWGSIPFEPDRGEGPQRDTVTRFALRQAFQPKKTLSWAKSTSILGSFRLGAHMTQAARVAKYGKDHFVWFSTEVTERSQGGLHE